MNGEVKEAMSMARAQDIYANPYPVYDVLREQSPVSLMPDGTYFLTRHADLVSVYRDDSIFSSDKKVEFEPSPLFAHHTTSLVFNNPPLHTRVRNLIMGALTRRAIAKATSSGKNCKVVSLAVGHYQITEAPEEMLFEISGFLK